MSVGQVIPPRYRPRPNSPVFPFNSEQTAQVLNVGGDARLGLVVGQDEIVVGIPTNKKSVLPRHLGIIGTTGSGKSTSVAGLVQDSLYRGTATQMSVLLPDGTRMTVLVPNADAEARHELPVPGDAARLSWSADNIHVVRDAAADAAGREDHEA